MTLAPRYLTRSFLVLGLLSFGLFSISPAAAIAADEPAAPCTVAAPTTAAQYEAAIDALNTDEWSGGDQSPSVLLPDGRVLWIYADTIQGSQNPDGSRAAGSRFVRNSVIIQDGGCFTPINGGGRASLIPNAANGDYYWPASAVLSGERILVFADRTRTMNPYDPFGFQLIGMEIAEFAVPAAGSNAFTFLGMAPTPSSGTNHYAIQWGRAAVVEGDTTYIYGAQNGIGEFVAGKSVFVAKAPTATLATPSTWLYWDGQAWTSNQFASHRVVQAAPRGWSYQFSVHKIGARYVALTKMNEYYGDTVSALTSTTPVGPWVEQPLFHAPSGTVPGELRYSATAHPEVALASGKLLVTVCRNNTDLGRVWADADLYKPDFYEVTLS